MSETTWTAEPWSIGRYGRVYNAKGKELIFAGLSLTSGNHPGEAEAGASVERFVACVNACSGMTDPQAEIASLKCQVRAAEQAHLSLAAVEKVFRDACIPWDNGQNAAVNVKRLITAQMAKREKQVRELREACDEAMRDIHLQSPSSAMSTLRHALEETK